MSTLDKFHMSQLEEFYEPVGPNNSLHSNLNLNVLIEKDSYEYQPSFF